MVNVLHSLYCCLLKSLEISCSSIRYGSWRKIKNTDYKALRLEVNIQELYYLNPLYDHIVFHLLTYILDGISWYHSYISHIIPWSLPLFLLQFIRARTHTPYSDAMPCVDWPDFHISSFHFSKLPLVSRFSFLSVLFKTTFLFSYSATHLCCISSSMADMCLCYDPFDTKSWNLVPHICCPVHL